MCLNTKICIALTFVGFVISAPFNVNVVSRFDNAGEEGDFFEGDIIMMKSASLKNLVRDPYELWPNKVLPYAFGEELDGAQRFNIETALSDLAAQTCVQFRKWTNETTHVVFRSYAGICASIVGYKDFRKVGGEMPVYVSSPGCELRGQIQHEVLHALGFWHEHTRPDRDNYVIVHWENMKQGMEINFEARTWKDTKTVGLPYDFGSVMHYRDKAFSKNDKATLEARTQVRGFQMGQRFRVSNLDIAKLNRLYSCDDRYYKGNDIAPS